MAVKILLADKSITIQKVVEMLFSGKDYEVVCVSDGEAALGEASRIVPDVILADVDLPRVDGYAFSGRLKQIPSVAQTPVILMMSRDDVFDAAKAKQSSILDHIVKPFESQELIGKVKKAVAAAPPRLAEPAAASRTAAGSGRLQAAPAPPARPAAPAAPPPKEKPKQAQPTDIFDIIQQAPSQADLRRTAPKPAEDEAVYEVEPVVEVEEPVAREISSALPVGEKAVEEMRAGLGLSGKPRQQTQETVDFEALGEPLGAPREYVPPVRKEPGRMEPKQAAPAMREAREYAPPAADPAPAVSDERLRSIAEDIITRIARDHFKHMAGTGQAGVSRDMVPGIDEQTVSRVVREVAREVIEKVVWEVVPDLAAVMIREEIERLKAEQ